MDIYIDGYVLFNFNFTSNNIYILAKSIIDIILNLKLNNYIFIIAIIFLMGLVMLKFNLNKNVENIYI
jgi:hypothetical protein